MGDLIFRNQTESNFSYLTEKKISFWFKCPGLKLLVYQHLTFKPSRMYMDLFITSCTDTDIQMEFICLNTSTFFMFTEIQSLLAWSMMHVIY